MLRKLVSGLALAAILPFSLGLAPVRGPRKFHLTVTWEKHSPDGVSRDQILINGQFPGPVLEINEGEDVWVTVENKLPEATTIHYHGIEMDRTAWSDGVPGVSQREIAPGKSYVYKWKATNYGEYWYHAHHRGQIDDGQYGAIIIHPKSSRPSPFGLISSDRNTVRAIEKAVGKIKPLILGDWRDITAAHAWDIEVASQMEIPCYDSLLINGKGKVNCFPADKLASLLSPQQKKLLQIVGKTAVTAKGCLPKEVIAKVISVGMPTNISNVPADIFDICTPNEGSNTVININDDDCDKDGTWVALSVVGGYGTVTTAFSIDELPMWIYAVDGEYIVPQRAHAITIRNGDRYSVLVHITDAGDYTIRHANTLPVQILSGEATLSYSTKKRRNHRGDRHNDHNGHNGHNGHGDHNGPDKRSSTPYINEAGAPLTADVVFFNQTAQKSYPASPIPVAADQTIILEMGNTDTKAYKWSMNGTAISLDLDEQDPPILFKPQPNLLNNLTITTLNNTWVDLVFVATQVPQPAHPIHKHGNKMWLLGSGNGLFKWSSVAEAALEIPQSFNLVDPPRRDGFATLNAGTGPTWTAVRYHVTNPGAWMLHCHIQTHLMGGMAMVIQDGVDHWPTVPPEYLAYGV